MADSTKLMSTAKRIKQERHLAAPPVPGSRELRLGRGTGSRQSHASVAGLASPMRAAVSGLGNEKAGGTATQAPKDVDVKPTILHGRTAKDSRLPPVVSKPAKTDMTHVPNASLSSIKFKRNTARAKVETEDRMGSGSSSLATGQSRAHPIIKKEPEKENDQKVYQTKYSGSFQREPRFKEDPEFGRVVIENMPSVGSPSVEIDRTSDEVVEPANKRLKGMDSLKAQTKSRVPVSLVPRPDVVRPIPENTTTVEKPLGSKKLFAPFFDRKMRTLRSPLPLTIFNPKWQQAALAYEDEKRAEDEDSSDEEEGLFYRGYPYPDEIRQDFRSWTLNHRNLHATLRDVYQFKTFAEWMLLHKANADKIMESEGFMAALRYDIYVRANAFAFRMRLPNGAECVSDVSVFRQDIKHITSFQVHRFNELGCQDNPYLPGGARYGYDPYTGEREFQADLDEPLPSNRFARKRANSHNQFARNPRYHGRCYDPNFSYKRNRANSRRPSGSGSNA